MVARRDYAARDSPQCRTTVLSDLLNTLCQGEGISGDEGWVLA
jgi:hypothetical protein